MFKENKFNYNPSLVVPTEGIVVDCSVTGGNPGYTECRGIDLQTKQIVFDEQIGMATNNIGEILAIVYGAAWVTHSEKKVPVYSDSQICIRWYHNQVIKTNFFKDYPHIAAQNKNLVHLLEEAAEIMEACRVDIRFWHNKRWGEIPADYNRK